MYYNLVVDLAFDPETINDNKNSSFKIDRSRVGEYTVQEIAVENALEMKSHLTLFLKEPKGEQDYYIYLGYFTDMTFHNNEIEISYNLVHHLNISSILPILDDLGIVTKKNYPWELNRTHIAVKNIDLLKIFTQKNLKTPQKFKNVYNTPEAMI